MSILDLLYPILSSVKKALPSLISLLSDPQHHMLSAHFVSSGSDWAEMSLLGVGTLFSHSSSSSSSSTSCPVLGTVPSPPTSQALAAELSGLQTGGLVVLVSLSTRYRGMGYLDPVGVRQSCVVRPLVLTGLHFTQPARSMKGEYQTLLSVSSLLSPALRARSRSGEPSLTYHQERPGLL